MTIKFTNNAATSLASGITNVATSLTVASGKGALFPTLSGGDVFYVTLANSSGVVEIVQVTARSTDTFTIVRGQDGTTAVAWNTGDKVELRPTAGVLTSFVQSANLPTSAVTSAVAGTAISVSGATGAVTINNTGVTSAVAGTGISVSGATGAVTITNQITGARGQVFTSSGTFTIPSGVSAVKVTVLGGGGGGGGAASNPCGATAAGGGGGAVAIQYFTGLTSGNTLSVAVGGAGAGGPAISGSGGTGGTSSVSSGTQTITTVQATGGVGVANSNGTGGNGGTFSGAVIGVNGQKGFSPTGTAAGAGGATGFGFGIGGLGGIASPLTAGGAGFGYGAGGGGSTNLNNGSPAGGAGGAGIVIVEW